MAVLNLRGIPDDLARQVKATAVSEGKTLVQFVTDILDRDMRRGGWTAVPAVAAKDKKRGKGKRASTAAQDEEF